MMKLRLIGFIFVIFFFFSLIVSAQIDDAQKKIDEAAENLEKNVTAIRGFTQADYWQNVGAQWKEVLLRNKFISEVNSFFISINFVFLILFGMDWSLSFYMLFAFLFWIFTLFSIISYVKSIDQGGLGFVYSFLALILLAQINLFEYVGKWSVALIFYKGSILWKVILFLVVLGIFVCFGIFNKRFSEFLKKRKEDKEKKKEKRDRETFGKMVNAAVEGAGSNRNLGGNPY